MEPVVQNVIQPGLEHATDLSLWGLFVSANWVAQFVMLVLIGASVWSWAIIVEKIQRLRALYQQADRFEEAFWSSVSLDRLYDQIGKAAQDPFSMVFSAAMREWRLSLTKSSTASLQQRIERVMHLTLGRQIDDLEKRIGFLASVGSTAPFIGLFGTVWGIMNSFQSIAASKNTSLAVVAPGIAEALFATAIGLVAAIPATIAYNKISSDIQRYANRLESFAAELGAILLRQMDERH